MLHYVGKTTDLQDIHQFPLQQSIMAKRRHNSISVPIRFFTWGNFLDQQIEARVWRSIQFNSVYFIHHKLKICLKGLFNLYTYNIPILWPHIESGETPKKSKKPFHREKREETFRRAAEEDPSPRMDRSNRWHVYITKHYRVALWTAVNLILMGVS